MLADLKISAQESAQKKCMKKVPIKKAQTSSNKKWKTWKSAIKSAQKSYFPINSAQIGTFFCTLSNPEPICLHTQPRCVGEKSHVSGGWRRHYRWQAIAFTHHPGVTHHSGVVGTPGWCALCRNQFPLCVKSAQTATLPLDTLVTGFSSYFLWSDQHKLQRLLWIESQLLGDVQAPKEVCVPLC